MSAGVLVAAVLLLILGQAMLAVHRAHRVVDRRGVNGPVVVDGWSVRTRSTVGRDGERISVVVVCRNGNWAMATDAVQRGEAQ